MQKTAVVLLALLATLIGACSDGGASNTTDGSEAAAPTITPASAPPLPCEDNWATAEAQMRQLTTIGGPAVKVVQPPSGTNILIGAEPPAVPRFEVYIPPKAVPDFDAVLDQIEPGSWVCVYGRVDKWKGTPEIDVMKPDNLDVTPAVP